VECVEVAAGGATERNRRGADGVAVSDDVSLTLFCHVLHNLCGHVSYMVIFAARFECDALRRAVADGKVFCLLPLTLHFKPHAQQVEARAKVATAMLAAASSSSQGAARRTPKAAGKDSSDNHVQSIIALLQVKF
jgi:hypothetical protein